MSYSKGVEECAKIGTSPVLPKSFEQNIALGEFMNAKNITKAFLGITLKHHSPKWIIGAESEYSIGLLSSNILVYLYCRIRLYVTN